MLRTLIITVSIACAAAVLASRDAVGGQPLPSPSGIRPMTRVDVAAQTGYFQDPYPIRPRGSAMALGMPTFSGTTKHLLVCPEHFQSSCSAGPALTLDTDDFVARASAAGAMARSFQNMNIFQDGAGRWQMAVTAALARPNGRKWNVILHARPSADRINRGMPTAWLVDALLVGDLRRPAADNYDGKYFEDAGRLYLVYNKQLVPGQDAVVTQPMRDAATPADSGPIPLLGPETNDGGYNSERAYGADQPQSIKLIETGNITKIGGKFVMTYSAGTFNRPGYKSGIAWSDSFLPNRGSYYKRVRRIDAQGVWGRPGHAEVQYLLQAVRPRWPNYVGTQVLAPGVPAIVRASDGVYYLTFAGYDPSDAPTNEAGLYKGEHRRPYYVGLTVRVPAGASVARTSPQDLADWVVPQLGRRP